MLKERTDSATKAQMETPHTDNITRADIYQLRADLENKIEKSNNKAVTIIGIALAFIGLLVAFK